MLEPRKFTLQGLRNGMQVFLNFPEVEEGLQEEIEQTVDRILLSKAQNGDRNPVDVLTDYLSTRNVDDMEERMKVIIGFSHGSLEKVKRIYEGVFPGERWSQLRSDEDKRRRVASFLIYPEAEEFFVPPFIRKSFSLPHNWIELLQDKGYLQTVVHGNMQSRYAVHIGDALEDEVRKIATDLGLSSQKGGVRIVDDKEVDIAIPNAREPQILIMSSYQLTTSSSQSSKANEQLRMYQDIGRYNSSRSQRDNPNVVFINVIDGGGWLSRPNDLQTMWDGCDYCFSYSSLSGLREVLQYYLND